MCARQDSHFRNWMATLGLSELMDDARFAGAPMRFACEEDVAELEGLVRDRMGEKTQAEWMQIFVDRYDVGADPFLTPAEFLEHPQMVMNSRVIELEDAAFGRVKQVGPLVLFSETPGRAEKSAPELAADRPSWVGLTAAVRVRSVTRRWVMRRPTQRGLLLPV